MDGIPQTSKKRLSSKCKLSRKQKVDFRNQKKLGAPFSDALRMVCRKLFRGEMSIMFSAFYVFLLQNKILLCVCCLCVSTSEKPLICYPPPKKMRTKWRPSGTPSFFVCRRRNLDGIPQTSKKGLSSKCKLPRKRKVGFRNQKKLGVPVSDALNMVCRKPFRGEMFIICFAPYGFQQQNENPLLRV